MATGAATAPSLWAALWRSLTRYEWAKVSPTIAARNTIGILVPLVVAALLGRIGPGLVMATGAMLVSFSDSHESYRVRCRRMLAACVAVGVAVFAGASSGWSDTSVVAVTTLWAFAGGMMVALSSTAADLGVLSLVMVIVFSDESLPPSGALGAGILAMMGGLFQTALALSLWPVRRLAPERQAIASMLLEVSEMATAGVSAVNAPPVSARSTEAQQALAALGTDRKPDSMRLRSVVNQSERIRLSLLALSRIRTRLSKNGHAELEVATLDQALAVAARLLAQVALSLRESVMPDSQQRELVQEFETTYRSIAAGHFSLPNEMAAMVTDAKHQLDALAGQLRSVVDLATATSVPGQDALTQAEGRRPWSLRFAGALVTLRANFTLQSAPFRHALRLGLAVGVGAALARELDFSRPYWVPMTIAIILKPDFGSTFARGLLRFAGTFIGLVLATGLVAFVYPQPAVEIALIAVFAFLLRCFGPVNYGILTAAVTAMLVLMMGLGGAEPGPLIAARALDTVTGGLVALAAYAAWPTWERKSIGETLARLLDSYRDYFRTIRQAYEPVQQPAPHALDAARLQARLARSNFEASVDRLLSEPGATAETASAFAAVLSSSHRVVHALMALDAGLAQSGPVPARDNFRIFGNGVELTLYYLAAALRGSPVTAEGLPDLREEHNRLIGAGDPGAERYALVNVETDRLTNSLNTLAEGVLAGIKAGRL